VRLKSGSFAAIQYPPNGGDEAIKFDGFCIELLAPRGNRLLALASQRMSGQGNDWNVLGLPVAFQTSGRFPAVNDGHFEVHQDDIRLLGCRHLGPCLAVLGRENLEIPKKLKPHFEHIHVGVIVFDIKPLRTGVSIPFGACWLGGGPFASPPGHANAVSVLGGGRRKETMILHALMGSSSHSMCRVGGMPRLRRHGYWPARLI